MNKKKIKNSFWILLLVVGTIWILAKHNTTPAYQKDNGLVFGTIYNITYQSDTNLKNEIETELRRFDGSLSPFNDTATITRINRNEDVVPDTFFTNVFKRSMEISKETDGAFDITVAQLANAWGFGFKGGAFPDSAMIDSLLQFTGYDKVTLSTEGKVVKQDPRTMLSCSAVAKGYAVDVVAALLERKGVKDFMIDTSFNIMKTDLGGARESDAYSRGTRDIFNLCMRFALIDSLYEKEKPLGVIAQFGGQTPLNLASELEKNGVRILGTSPAVIDLAEDRDQFRAMMDKLEIPMPESGMASTVQEALSIAKGIGYPVMVRPSYVLGGRGMEVVYDEESMAGYMEAAVGVTPDRPILIDRFLNHALECEADAISDGSHAFVPAVMEHIELAGIHSGDSACIIPSVHISEEHVETIKEYTRKIAEEMHVKGLMNMQYVNE